MNKKVRNISIDIRRGTLLDENIPQLFNHLADHYDTYAWVRLALHYYAFYESYCDEENLWDRDAKDTIFKLNHIIRENILQSQSGFEREKVVQSIDEMRKGISRRMDILTAYTDVFQIYEYILNRLEYRFHKNLDSVDAVEFTKEILRYIFDTEDNFIINEKIKEIIGQLPIRITKQKYFELLKESIRAYLGADQSSLDTYLYMLRTSAMLYHQDGMDSEYPRLREMKEKLSGIDYKGITKEDYERAVVTLQAATLMLETESTVYFGLQEIVNEVYALLLCAPYANMVDTDMLEAKKAAQTILINMNELFLENEKSELTMNLMEQFKDVEGVQEELSYELTELEDALFEVNKNYHNLIQSLMLEPLFEVLQCSQKLLSNSIFIDLEKEEDKGIVDEVRIEEVTIKLEDEFTKLFAGQDKIMSRAVIANSINKMPVFFKNHKEVMDYILYSFERCTDSYEKAACVEIIKTIMSD
ncbi:MAG: hypothetical protein PHF63_11430 [Herbinix sp.]|nr:hypothetical protein [Herbinix sp.]